MLSNTTGRYTVSCSSPVHSKNKLFRISFATDLLLLWAAIVKLLMKLLVKLYLKPIYGEYNAVTLHILGETQLLSDLATAIL